MQVVYHEAFPDRYLMTLVPSDSPEDAGFAAHLDRACRSRQRAVWIDCRLLKNLSVTAVWLLRACQHRLRRRQAYLVLCSAVAGVEQALRQVFPPADLCLVLTLDAVVNPLAVGYGSPPAALMAPAGFSSANLVPYLWPAEPGLTGRWQNRILGVVAEDSPTQLVLRKAT
ncbi:hypothetical protein A0257_22455 (plasmid) [Hymenobacter psoromatis]|nr:hypothetical protein A0257_22455 [Hymenobacter psoromatis]